MPGQNGKSHGRRPVIGISARSDRTTNPVELLTYSANQSYNRAVIGAGGAPVIVPLGMDEAGIRSAFEAVDAILIPGGGDVCPVLYGADTHQSVWGIDDARDQLEMALVQLALEHAKPLLAVCRGAQILNVATGGDLIQDIHTMVPGAQDHFYYPGYTRDYLAHTIEIDADSSLAAIYGMTEVPVNSMHHQALGRIGNGLRVIARAHDGIVEAVEAPDHPWAVGVQFHPEELTAHAHMRALFEAFVAAAAHERVAAQG
jgi:putative glutamine amidotransferase